MLVWLSVIEQLEPGAFSYRQIFADQVVLCKGHFSSYLAPLNQLQPRNALSCNVVLIESRPRYFGEKKGVGDILN